MGDILRDPILQGVAAVLAIAGVALAVIFFVFPASRGRLRVWLGVNALRILRLALPALILLWIGYSLGRSRAMTNLPLAQSISSEQDEQSRTLAPSRTVPAQFHEVTRIVTEEVTRIVTSVVTQISTVVVTPLPPTATQTPTITLPFEDNFDTGLSSAWTVVSGNPLVVNNMLTVDKETWLSIGDASWSDYRVEFEVVDTSTCPLIEQGLNFVGVRMIDPGNGLLFGWTGCRSKWYVTENGEIAEVPGTNDESDVKDGVKVSVEVAGDRITSHVGVNQTSTFVHAAIPSGGVVLRLLPTTFIDNFKVTSLSE